MKIWYITVNRNPADSLSRQLVSDVLVRKKCVKDANTEYVQQLGLPGNASDANIQTIFHQLFSQGPQGHTVLLNICPEGESNSRNEDKSAHGDFWWKISLQ